MQIVVSSFEETLPHHHFENAADYAVETARHKALDVAKVCAAQNGKAPVDLIISADTVSATGDVSR
jgi:septum formation protein